MKRGLRLRLAITHALVALLAIVVVAVIVNAVDGRRLDLTVSAVPGTRGTFLFFSMSFRNISSDIEAG